VFAEHPEDNSLQDAFKWPANPDQVSTADERLDTSYVGADSRDPPEKAAAKLVTKAIIVDEDDDFEQLAVGEFGDITIWTRDKVWCIRRSHGLEKLMDVPRHPPSNAGS
jgi:hypothetical protein